MYGSESSLNLKLHAIKMRLMLLVGAASAVGLAGEKYSTRALRRSLLVAVVVVVSAAIAAAELGKRRATNSPHPRQLTAGVRLRGRIKRRRPEGSLRAAPQAATSGESEGTKITMFNDESS